MLARAEPLLLLPKLAKLQQSIIELYLIGALCPTCGATVGIHSLGYN